MSDEQWRVHYDPHDSWYQYRIYDGDTLIVNVRAVGSAGAKVAERIVADHNGAAGEREAALREALHGELAALLGDIRILTADMEPGKRARYINCERVERIRRVLGIDLAPTAEQDAGAEVRGES